MLIYFAYFSDGFLPACFCTNDKHYDITCINQSYDFLYISDTLAISSTSRMHSGKNDMQYPYRSARTGISDRSGHLHWQVGRRLLRLTIRFVDRVTIRLPGRVHHGLAHQGPMGKVCQNGVWWLIKSSQLIIARQVFFPVDQNYCFQTRIRTRLRITTAANPQASEKFPVAYKAATAEPNRSASSANRLKPVRW